MDQGWQPQAVLRPGRSGWLRGRFPPQGCEGNRAAAAEGAPQTPRGLGGVHQTWSHHTAPQASLPALPVTGKWTGPLNATARPPVVPLASVMKIKPEMLKVPAATAEGRPGRPTRDQGRTRPLPGATSPTGSASQVVNSNAETPLPPGLPQKKEKMRRVKAARQGPTTPTGCAGVKRVHS